MNRCFTMFVGAAAVLAALGAAYQPADPARPATPAPSAPAAPVAALSFLRGTWSGAMEDAQVEETWSAPTGDSIVGMFRWQEKGETTMWELLSIRAEDGAAVLRLRHFGADFTPWKGECDGVAPMKATTVEKSRVVFTNASVTGGVASCEYHVTTPDTLTITVSFKPASGREPLKFSLTRAH